MKVIRLMCLFLMFPVPAIAEEVSIAVNANWAPFTVKYEGHTKGLLVDLLNAIIVERMGYSIRYSPVPWKRAQLQVKSGRSDIMLTYPSDERLTYSERSENVVFALEERAFVKTGSRAEQVLREGTSVEKMKAFRVCVILGDNWATGFFKKHNIPYHLAGTTDNCVRMLAADHMDVFVQSATAGLSTIHKTALEDKITMLPHIYSSVPFALLVSRKSPHKAEFLSRFDETVSAMKNDGSYDKLIDKLRRAAR